MTPFDSLWFALGVPAGAVILALVAYGFARGEAHRLDRKYGQGH